MTPSDLGCAVDRFHTNSAPSSRLISYVISSSHLHHSPLAAALTFALFPRLDAS